MKKQSYSNYKRYDPWFHGLLLSMVIATMVISGINFITSLDNRDRILGAGSLFLMSLILGIMYYFLRSFGVRLQDRIIRAEENFRHFALTTKPLDARLQMHQIIALRFSPDAEFVDLCKRAAEEGMTAEQIKKSIYRWKGDYHRI